MDIYEFTRGTIPLVMSIPHVGEYIPPETEAQMTAPPSGAIRIGTWTGFTEIPQHLGSLCSRLTIHVT